ncbi:MAG TPA: DUF488 domain-containing protein [Anaerolineaceae bacterium]
MMNIHIKRAYEAPSPSDGQRFLVDRLWPRGVKRENLLLAGWLKEIAPSNKLREQFHHDQEHWSEFRQQYWRELDDKQDQLKPLIEAASSGPVTLVYAARDTERNNAVALRDYLNRKN